MYHGIDLGHWRCGISRGKSNLAKAPKAKNPLPIAVEHCEQELELELIQTQMTQKPMLRAEVYARALRASQNRKEDSV